MAVYVVSFVFQAITFLLATWYVLILQTFVVYDLKSDLYDLLLKVSNVKVTVHI